MSHHPRRSPVAGFFLSGRIVFFPTALLGDSMFHGPGPGRPSSKTPEICAEICERISRDEPLTKICADEHMPSWQSVYEWLDKDPEFSRDYARAKKIAAAFSVGKMAVIEDDVLAGKVDPNAARTAIWSKQWRAARADPGRFGDRQVIAGDSAAPLETRTSVSFEGLDPAARAALKSVLESVAARDGGEPDKA